MFQMSFGKPKRPEGRDALTREYIKEMRAAEASDRAILLDVVMDLAHPITDAYIDRSDVLAVELEAIAQYLRSPERKEHRRAWEQEEQRNHLDKLDQIMGRTRNEVPRPAQPKGRK